MKVIDIFIKYANKEKLPNKIKVWDIVFSLNNKNTYGNISQHRKSEIDIIDKINELIENQNKQNKIIKELKEVK